MEKAKNRILYRGGIGEVVEKKSRFIAQVQSIRNEEEALGAIAGIKKKYWDARHNCYAYVAGENHSLQRCSDDGEPQGTAGRPMLEVLLKEDIHDALVVVTRYFGGTLLGTGGLVRAYQKAVLEGLKNCVIVEKQRGELLTIQTDYNGIGKVQYILAGQGIAILDAVYEEQVRQQVMVPLADMEKLMKELTEATSGTAQFCHGDQKEFALVDGEVKIF